MIEKTCPCGIVFQAKSGNAKWHDAACRKRHQRSGTAASAARPSRAAARTRTAVSRAGGDVLRATRAELRSLGKLETLEGRQALLMATRIADPSENGAAVARLSERLGALMDRLRASADDAGDPVAQAQAQVRGVLRLLPGREG